MKKILAMILAAMLLFTLVSCGEKGDEGGAEIQDAANSDIYVDPETNDKFAREMDELGGYAIVGFTSGSSTPHKVVIPAEIDGVEVTGIGTGAFKLNGYVSEVEIPSSVEYIDDFAFYGCNYLKSVTMTDSVVELGVGVFENCTVLENVKLTAAIEKLPAYLFLNCKALKTVAIPEKVTEIGDGAYMGCSAVTEVTVPANVKNIGDCAFYGMTALTKATVPANVETLGQYVFNAAAEGFVLSGKADSAAQAYALENEYTFEVIA